MTEERLMLDFTSGVHRQDQPFSIYKDTTPLRENLVARIVRPNNRTSGQWISGMDARATANFTNDDIRRVVQMTLSPEMWELLKTTNAILDSIRITRPGRTTNIAAAEGLWDAHDEIKELIHRAPKVARKVRLYGDDKRTLFEM